MEKNKNENEELVTYTAPLLPGGARQDITVAVNGRNTVVERQRQQRCLTHRVKCAIGPRRACSAYRDCHALVAPAAVVGYFARRGPFCCGSVSNFVCACGEFRALRGATRDAVPGLCGL